MFYYPVDVAVILDMRSSLSNCAVDVVQVLSTSNAGAAAARAQMTFSCAALL